MRQVTEQIAKAFLAGESKTVGNTRTDGQNVWLHGNLIARKTDFGFQLTLAGWPTPTTRERLNGILKTFGFSSMYHQRNRKALLDDSTFDIKGWQSFGIINGGWFRC